MLISYFRAMHIRIPIKRYLVKYLIARLGKDTLELKRVTAFEVALSENNIKATLQKQISDVIFPVIQSIESYDLDYYLKNDVYTLISLNLGNRIMQDKRVCISAKGVTKLNEAIYDIMMDELMNRVYNAMENNNRVDLIILAFMSECNISEDDIRFDSLKKNCYRKRSEIASKIFSNKNNAIDSAVLNLSFDKQLIR